MPTKAQNLAAAKKFQRKGATPFGILPSIEHMPGYQAGVPVTHPGYAGKDGIVGGGGSLAGGYQSGYGSARSANVNRYEEAKGLWDRQYANEAATYDQNRDDIARSVRAQKAKYGQGTVSAGMYGTTNAATMEKGFDKTGGERLLNSDQARLQYRNSLLAGKAGVVERRSDPYPSRQEPIGLAQGLGRFGGAGAAGGGANANDIANRLRRAMGGNAGANAGGNGGNGRNGPNQGNQNQDDDVPWAPPGWEQRDNPLNDLDWPGAADAPDAPAAQQGDPADPEWWEGQWNENDERELDAEAVEYDWSGDWYQDDSGDADEPWNAEREAAALPWWADEAPGESDLDAQDAANSQPAAYRTEVADKVHFDSNLTPDQVEFTLDLLEKLGLDAFLGEFPQYR